MVLSDLQRREAAILASYAVTSVLSRGRDFPEDEHPLRSAFQRDRDRIAHTTAWRRLEYKTQVFVNHEGDYYRTRLTHTIEVALIARTIARALQLNEDLVEAICFAHDLGHPPFGHAGEAALNVAMQPYGGFEHNTQSLRIVEWLEERYPGFRGLNLTWEVREGMLKHPTHGGVLTPDALRLRPSGWPTLEGQLSDLADAVAYNAHDLDDGLRAGLLTWEELRGEPFLAELIAEVEGLHEGLPASVLRHQLVRRVIDTQVNDLVAHTAANIERLGLETLADVQTAPERIVTFTPPMAHRHTELKRFLRRYLYEHPRVERMGQDAAVVIAWLFDSFMRDPAHLPPPVQVRLAEGDDPVPRIICDYIAGMTDRFALHEFAALGGDMGQLAPAWLTHGKELGNDPLQAESL